MKRDVSNKINYVLDNWLPPAVRDSRLFGYLLLRMAVGKEYKQYMEFKGKFPFLSEKEVNTYYDELANTFMKRETNLNTACIKRILQEVRGKNVLDAAAGSGYMAELIAEKVPDCIVSAVDIEPPAKKSSRVNYKKASLTSLPYADKEFDTVICTHALEHIKDVQRALEELRRVCRERLIIVLPRQREYRYTVDLHVNFFPYDFDVQSLLMSNASVELLDNDWFCVEDVAKDA